MNTLEPAKLSTVKQWLNTPKSSYVDGRWLHDNDAPTFTTENPANRQTLATLREGTRATVDQAAQAAGRAFKDDRWRLMTRRDRAKLLQGIAQVIRKHQAELATIEALGNGKLYAEAFLDDLPETADVFDYYAGWIDKFHGEQLSVEQGFLNYTVREPLGVCALIVPWNFPLLLAAWKIAPALAMGNTIIVEPSPFTSLSMVRLFELLTTELQILPGVLNLVLGGAVPGDAITSHPQIHKISFTGSTAIGKRILGQAAASNLKHVTLELGGKSPNIIFADAPDLDFAIERSFTAMFSHKGEKCSGPTRLLVERPIYDKVVKRLAELAEQVVCGDPFDAKATQGAQANGPHFEKILHYIELGKASGAKLVAGGKADTTGTNKDGYFVRPTIFADVDNKMAIAQDEIFGPVLCIIPFSTEEEAIAIANDTPYGLAAGLWTADVSRSQRVSRALDAGMVFVNRYGCYDFASPFGGFKQSGWGKEMGLHSLDAYTKLKSVWIKV